ncbi:PEGA domain-containing protein [Candidatus Omnitrophota bacterium]
MSKMTKYLVIVCAVLLLSGCATIMHGDSQYVEIDSYPQGATAYIDGTYHVTPAKVLLKRGHPMKDYTILLEKEGYKPGYAKVEQKLSAWLWGDIVWAIVPGVAVDLLTGGAFKLRPQRVTVELEESAAPMVEETPAPPKRIK